MGLERQGQPGYFQGITVPLAVLPGGPARRGGAGAPYEHFSLGKNLGAGGIHFPRALKSYRVPTELCFVGEQHRRMGLECQSQPGYLQGLRETSTHLVQNVENFPAIFWAPRILTSFSTEFPHILWNCRMGSKFMNDFPCISRFLTYTVFQREGKERKGNIGYRRAVFGNPEFAR